MFRCGSSIGSRSGWQDNQTYSTLSEEKVTQRDLSNLEGFVVGCCCGCCGCCLLLLACVCCFGCVSCVCWICRVCGFSMFYDVLVYDYVLVNVLTYVFAVRSFAGPQNHWFWSWGGVGWGNTNPMSCSANWSSLLLLHELDATLLDLHLYFYMSNVITAKGFTLWKNGSEGGDMLMSTQVALTPSGQSSKRVCRTGCVIPNRTLTSGSISAVPNGVGRLTAQVCWPKQVSNWSSCELQKRGALNSHRFFDTKCCKGCKSICPE